MRLILRPWALWFLLFGFSVAGLRPACAQTVTILHSFGDGSVVGDGNAPFAPLVLGSDGNFYGTTGYGGAANTGTAFTITPSGTETVLFNFGNGLFNFDTYPVAALVFGPDGNLYGTTSAGGTTSQTNPPNLGYGAAFRMTTAGEITTLHDFSDGSVTNDGQSPATALTLSSDGNFYGTTIGGGSANDGTVFKITSAGATTILHNFGDGSVSNDGVAPEASLVQGGDGNFYGTTEYGGSFNVGTVFKMTPSGTVTILHSFGDGAVSNDGQYPVAALMQGSDGDFYGTTSEGGAITVSAPSGSGTVFKMTPSGTVTILHSFRDGTVSNDGQYPEAALLQGPDGNFYGTSEGNGSAASGSLFEITPAGNVTILHSFGDGSIINDGTFPQTALVLGSDDNLYGTTTEGGSSNDGTIFRCTLAPPQNDDLVNGIAIVAGPANPATVTGSNFGATQESGEPLNTSESGRHSVWWTWTASGTGTATIDTFGSDFDTTLGIYKGNAVNALTQVAANDDAGGTLQSSVTFNAVAGTTYQISVDGYSYFEGNISLHVAQAVPALPTITTIAPTSGPVGTHVTVTGTNFTGTNIVRFHNANAVTFSVNGAGTQITVTVPTGAGTGTITVTAPGGSVKSAQTFTVAVPAVPTITSLSPTSGPVGTLVTITGTNFTGGPTIKFHGTTATSYTVVSTTSITATVPTGATTGTISVTTPGGTATSGNSFTVTVPPTITSISPTSGPVGTVVTVTGTNFTGTTVVRFHNANAVTFSINGAGTQITVTVPTGAGTGTITVTTPGGSVKSAQTFTVS